MMEYFTIGILVFNIIVSALTPVPNRWSSGVLGWLCASMFAYLHFFR